MIKPLTTVKSWLVGFILGIGLTAVSWTLAATSTWSGGASPDNEWSTVGNWDALPTDDTSTDIALFDGTAGSKSVVLTAAGRSIGSVFIQADGYALSGTQVITIGTGGTDGAATSISGNDKGQFHLQQNTTLNQGLDFNFVGTSVGRSKITIGQDADWVMTGDINFTNTTVIPSSDDYKHIHTGVRGNITLSGNLIADIAAADQHLIFDLGTAGTDGTNNGTFHINSDNSGNISLNAGRYIRIWDGKFYLGANNALDTEDIRMEMGSNNSLLISGAFEQQNNVTLYAGSLNSSRLHILGGTNTSGTAEFSGNFNIEHAGAGTFGYARIDLEAAAGGTVLFSGAFTTVTASGAVQQNVYRKTGAGTVVLSGDNDFDNGKSDTPTLAINAGTLRISHANALGGSGASKALEVTIASGATLDITNSITYNPASDITVGGAGVSSLGALRSSSGSNTIGSAGDIVLSSNTTIGVDSGASLTIERALTESSGGTQLTKVGDGTLTLSATNTYTGDTVIDAGTFALGADNVINSASDVILNGGTFATNSFDNTLGNLTLTEDSIIHMGSGGNSVLIFNFGGSPTVWTATKTLSIAGFNSTDSLQFHGLTSAEVDTYLTFMSFAGYGGIDKVDLTGNNWSIVGTDPAVPEPSTYLFGGLLLLVIVVRIARNRARHLA